MRGKEYQNKQHPCIQGITPAYAGKSLEKAVHERVERDHPRVCGEKLMPDTALTGDGRITPAYAGKSVTEADCCVACQDHPRVCGEK